MATNNRPSLTHQQALLERVMREALERVQDAGLVLKAVGALVLPGRRGDRNGRDGPSNHPANLTH